MIFTIKKFPDVNSSLKRNAILIVKKKLLLRLHADAIGFHTPF